MLRQVTSGLQNISLLPPSQQGLRINRRFSVGIVQLILKQFQRKMAFYYYFNPNPNALPVPDQFQSYLPNFASLFSQNDDLCNGSYYTWTWPQNDLPPQNEGLMTAATSNAGDDMPNPSLVSPEPAPKKRRAEKTLEKEIISAKKNSQSNLINQFYSFFGSKEKSEKIVEKCCLLQGKSSEQVEKILPVFYMSVRYINAKRGRKYVNAAMLLKFFTPEDFGEYLTEFKEKMQAYDFLNLGELCQIFRRCTVYFLKNISVTAILTSKRISIVSKEEHLKKRRKVLRSIMEN